MTTATALGVRCATRFRDSAFVVVTAANWLDYCNESYRELNMATPLWPWLESSELSTTVNAGLRCGDLAADVVQVNWVYNVTDDVRMMPSEGRGAQWRDVLRSDTSQPITYRLRNKALEVFPLPTVNTLLKYEAVLFPVDLAGGDEPTFPEAFHNLLIDGMLAKAYADDGNAEWNKLHEEKWQLGIQNMKMHVLAFRTESYTPVRDTFFL